MARLTFPGTRPGIPMDNATDFQNRLRDKGLFYEVEKVERMNPRTGGPTGFYEVYRTDTDTMLGAGVTDRYHVVQNWDAFSPMGPIIEEHAQGGHDKIALTRARTWDGGRGAVVSLNIGEMKIGPRSIGDIVKKELNLKNAHGGNGSLILNHSTYRLACGNGACSIEKMGVAIRHTATAQARLQEFYRGFSIIQAQAKRTEAAYQVLALTPMDQEQRKKFLSKLVPVKGTKQADKKAEETIRTMFENMENADNGFTPKDTAWNAFNGVTHYTTHDLATRSHGGKAAEESRDQSMIEGAGALLNHRALTLLVKEFSLDAQIEALLAQMDTTPAAMALAGMADAPSITDQILDMMQ